MTTLLKTALAAGLAFGLAMTVTDSAEAKRKSCAVLAGSGTGVLPDVAKDQALWQLSDAAKTYGGKVAGKANVTCKYQLVVSECVAKQRYCK